MSKASATRLMAMARRAAAQSLAALCMMAATSCGLGRESVSIVRAHEVLRP
jgi:hypothetical protein